MKNAFEYEAELAKLRDGLESLRNCMYFPNGLCLVKDGQAQLNHLQCAQAGWNACLDKVKELTCG